MENKPQNVICQNCKGLFTIEPDDFGFYEKIKVPPPTWCPQCRLKRKFAHRNERSLYKRKCDLCKENIISMYSPKSPYIVYCPTCWFSDNWDQYKYGRDYDLSRNFFEQFMELDKSVPHLALLQVNNINSPWVNYEADNKNCYLSFGGHLNQDSAYNQYAVKSRDTFDTFWMMHGEFCYESILCENTYKTFGSIFTFECQEAWFSFDCRNCSNIIGCSGLRHKKNYIFNKPVTEEEYKKFVNENINGSRTKFNQLKEESKKVWQNTPQRALFIERSSNCSGDLIKDSRNCHNVWNVEKSENISNAIFSLEMRDSMDILSVWRSELSYEIIAGIDLSNVSFCSNIFGPSTNVYYSNMLYGANNCFGSSHIKHGEYIILNKKYTKEDYERLVPKIIEQMKEIPYMDKKGRIYKYGEFFPYESSPFNYDESTANEYFPLSREEIEKEGANLYDYQVETHYDTETIIPPDSIHNVDSSILNKAIKCEETGKLFKIIQMELDFYKRFNLPLPTKSPFARHHKRLRFISDHMKLLKRNCGNCKQEIDSVYTEEEFPVVYCEKCYQKEVY